MDFVLILQMAGAARVTAWHVDTPVPLAEV